MERSVSDLRIALLLGDRNGVGPELAAGYLAAGERPPGTRLVVIGDARVLAAGARSAGVELKPGAGWSLEDRRAEAEVGPLGEITAASGREMLSGLDRICELIEAAEIDAAVYAPLNKQALALAGHKAGDELDYLSTRLARDGGGAEINILGALWTSRVTSHLPLRAVADQITGDRVAGAVRTIDTALRQSGVAGPRVAVAALNPHAGEGGLYGSEEREIIAPAIEALRTEGLDVAGPFPADTVFPRARAGAFDAVVTMYHDQGQIALKLLGLGQSVTLLAGFRVPIATPGHGTAYDIAGKGIARRDGFAAAVATAARMAGGQR